MSVLWKVLIYILGCVYRIINGTESLKKLIINEHLLSQRGYLYSFRACDL